MFVLWTWAIFAFSILSHQIKHDTWKFIEKKSFRRLYIYAQRATSSCSCSAHGCSLSAFQQPSAMAYTGQLVHAPSLSWCTTFQARIHPEKAAYEILHLSVLWLQSPLPNLPPADSALGWLEARAAKCFFSPWDLKEEWMRHRVMPK